MAKFNRTSSNQDGVTLLLSVLILSAVTVITITVTYFAVVELRASRGNTLTEPAIMAAETAGEQGIWAVKRGTVPPECSDTGTNTYTNLDGGTGTSRTLQAKCAKYGPVTFRLTAGTPVEIYLYDPANINGNLNMTLDGTTASSPLFSSLRVDVAEGTAYAVNVTATTLDGLPITGTATNPTVQVTAAAPLIVGPPLPRPSLSSDQRIKVTMDASVGTATVTVTVTSPTIHGLPGFPSIDAIGCSSTNGIYTCDQTGGDVFKRRLKITVPL